MFAQPPYTVKIATSAKFVPPASFHLLHPSTTAVYRISLTTLQLSSKRTFFVCEVTKIASGCQLTRVVTRSYDLTTASPIIESQRRKRLTTYQRLPDLYKPALFGWYRVSSPSDFSQLWQTVLLGVSAELIPSPSPALSIFPSSSNIYHSAVSRTSRVAPQFSLRRMFLFVDEVSQTASDVS